MPWKSQTKKFSFKQKCFEASSKKHVLIIQLDLDPLTKRVRELLSEASVEGDSPNLGMMKLGYT